MGFPDEPYSGIAQSRQATSFTECPGVIQWPTVMPRAPYANTK
jgi:hypothetical protein